MSKPAHSPGPVGCTNLKLRQLTRCVTQRYDADLASCGLKTTQYSLLSCALKRGPIQPSVMADLMRMDASTLTRNLKPLIGQGWITLSPGADGRSRVVQITEAGRAKRAAAQALWRRAQDRLKLQLGAQRVAALHALLDEALALLDTPLPRTEP